MLIPELRDFGISAFSMNNISGKALSDSQISKSLHLTITISPHFSLPCEKSVVLKPCVFVTTIILALLRLPAQAQKVDSIFFHLYTDSLKKGTFNYINVDGKLSNGRWQPLTGKELVFTSSYGSFDGNSLFVDTACKEEKIMVTAVLKADTTIRKTSGIYIKTMEQTEKLRTVEEVMQGTNTSPAGKRKRNQ